MAIERDLRAAMAQQWVAEYSARNLKIWCSASWYVGTTVTFTHLLTDGVVAPRNLNRADIDFLRIQFKNACRSSAISFLVGYLSVFAIHSMQVIL